MTEQIWYKDPSSLFVRENWYKFVPVATMTIPEALNAVVRFTVYFVSILAITTGETSYFAIIPMVLLASILFDKVFPDGATIESFKIKSKVSGPKEGYTMPTAANPFMNVLLTDIQDNPNRGDAAPITRRDIKKKIYDEFQKTSDMHMDTTDLFDQSQAMRTFHTIQSAKVPNDLDGFKKWLAKGIDEPDFSSAPPARYAKTASEGYVHAKGSMKDLPSTTTKPAGTSPSAATTVSKGKTGSTK
jgi:hypothetical protein